MPIPENVENLRRVSAKSSIYQVVCSWIITGVLKPGEKIVDSELAKRFNVSRTPVREAIQILEGQKLVYVVPGRATVVADIDPADIEKCYRPLADLEALAAELACGKLTENDFFELECALRDAKAASLRQPHGPGTGAAGADSRRLCGCLRP